MIEWTPVPISNLVTALVALASFFGTAFGFYNALRRSIDMTSERLLLLSGRMINVENELKEMQKVLIALAVQSEKMISYDRQLLELRTSSDEWRNWVRNELNVLRARHVS